MAISAIAEDQVVEKAKRSVMLLPVHNLAADEEYASLAYTIFNVFELNLKKQDSLELFTDDGKILAAEETTFESLMNKIADTYHVETCVLSEYYVSADTLHTTITVVDVATSRIKSCYIKTMPADQGRYDTLDAMCSDISIAIGRDLPLLERDALVQKQVVTGLRQKLDYEERLLNEVYEKNNEIAIIPCAGVNLGRTVISWSEARPPLYLPLGLEYSFFFGESYHVRAGIEYLPFDLKAPDIKRTEAGIDLLIGIHTRSLFSFSIDTGLALTYDYNGKCDTLAAGSSHTGPRAERWSLSIPLSAGWSLYFNDTFFTSFRLTCYGLTYTFETMNPSQYEGGSSMLKYLNGFSPFNLLCLTLSTSVGVRF
jgi:hypothetical protein